MSHNQFWDGFGFPHLRNLPISELEHGHDAEQAMKTEPSAHRSRAPGHLVPGQWCSSSYSKGGSSCRGYIPKTWGLPWWQLGTPFTHRSEFSPCLNLYPVPHGYQKKQRVQSLWNHQIVVYGIPHGSFGGMR